MKYALFNLILCVAIGGMCTVPSIVTAQQTAIPSIISEQAYKLIQEAQNTMSLIDEKLSELANLSSLPTGGDIVMQVSLAEITGKVQVSRNLLDQALMAYSAQDYTKSAILAFRSKQNTLLTTLYLEGLMNKAGSSLGVSRLELDGSFADLLKLRNLIQVVVPSMPEELETSTPKNPEDPTSSTPAASSTPDQVPIEPTSPTQEPVDVPTDEPQVPLPVSTTTTPTTPDSETPVPPVNPKVQACIDKGLITCKTQETTCITKSKQVTSRCQATFDAGIASCKRYEVRAETYMIKCTTNRNTCQTTATTTIKKARCQAQFAACEVRAGLSKSRDLAAANTCVAKQTTKKATCDLAYTNRVNTLLVRCATNLTACDTRVKARCTALTIPKSKAK